MKLVKQRGRRRRSAALAAVTAVLVVGSPVLVTTRAAAGEPVGLAEPPATQRVTVAATADTYVVAEQPAQTFGTAVKLAASNWSTPWHSDAYVRFAVPQPPTGSRIVSARVEFTFQKLDQRPARIELRSVASATWPESTTSYANRPASGAVVATASVGQDATTVSFAVTSALGVGSFALTNPSAQSSAVVHSREHGPDGPRLVLEYAPTASPLCGVSFTPEPGESWQQALTREDALFNGVEAVRTFYGGPPAPWPGQVNTGDRAHVISFKGNARDHVAGRYDNQLRTWFANAPRNKDIYWIYYHEPEDNIRDGEFTAAEYRAAWVHLSNLAKTADNPRLHATQVLMEWTLNPASGRDWRDYYPGAGVLDVLAWDVYNYDPRAAEGKYVPPGELIDHIVEANRSVGLPFGIAELGSHLALGDTGARRAQWIREMNDYLTTRGSLWNLWFDLNWPTGDYRLRDTGGVAAWREFCT